MAYNRNITFVSIHKMYELLGDDIIYVYPDMETVLVGRFEGGSMEGARKSKIIAERCNKGIKEIIVAKKQFAAYLDISADEFDISYNG